MDGDEGGRMEIEILSSYAVNKPRPVGGVINYDRLILPAKEKPKADCHSDSSLFYYPCNSWPCNRQLYLWNAGDHRTSCCHNYCHFPCKRQWVCCIFLRRQRSAFLFEGAAPAV